MRLTFRNPIHGQLMRLPATVLADLWGINSSVERSTFGVSRTTWRVAEGFWLTCCDAERAEAFRRECHLLHALGEIAQANPELMLVAPRLVPATSGEFVLLHSGFLWLLTCHIEGAHPSADDPATCDLMANALLRLHRALDLIPDPRPACPNILDGVRDRLAKLSHTLSESSFTGGERDILNAAANWLRPRLDRLSVFPTRVVHGDWTPLNVLIRQDGRAGILDLEACGQGPAVLDYANMGSTLLMWSKLDNIPGRIAELVSRFEEKTGVPLGLDIVHIAMLTHWFEHYFEWRERELTAENSEVVQRLLGRIQTVLRFVAT